MRDAQFSMTNQLRLTKMSNGWDKISIADIGRRVPMATLKALQIISMSTHKYASEVLSSLVPNLFQMDGWRLVW